MDYAEKLRLERKEKLSKKLEAELKKIDLTDEKVLVSMVAWDGPLPDAVGFSIFKQEIPDSLYVKTIAYFLELALRKRDFDLTDYNPSTIDFYTKCYANELIINEDIDPKDIILKFYEYYKLNSLKPKGKVLEEFLKLPTKDETK